MLLVVGPPGRAFGVRRRVALRAGLGLLAPELREQDPRCGGRGRRPATAWRRVERPGCEDMCAGRIASFDAVDIERPASDDSAGDLHELVGTASITVFATRFVAPPKAIAEGCEEQGDALLPPARRDPP
jgi:hypothetical protein